MYLAISFLVPFTVYLNYNLNKFYIYGDGVLDSGWFIYLSTHICDTLLQNPPLLIPTHLGDTYLNTHISPIFILFEYLYKYIFFFLPPPVYFASILAALFATVSLAVYIAGRAFDINRSLLVIISILVAFNGQSLATVGFPHFEVAIPAFITLFLVFLFRGYIIGSYIVFVLLLATREDAGFHLFGVVAVMAVIEYLYTKTLFFSKKILRFAVTALLYSVTAVLIQKSLYGADDAFVRIYSGENFYAHLNRELILDRLKFVLEYREYIYVPALISTLFATVYKNPYLLIPVLALIPWTLLSITAITYMPSSLSNYYASIYILLFTLYPIAVYMKREGKKHFLIYSIIPLSSTLLFPYSTGNVDNYPWQKMGFEYIDSIKPTSKFIQSITTDKERFGNILFDEAMSLFVIDNITLKEYGYLNQFKQKQIEDVDTVIFKKSSYSYGTMLNIITKEGLYTIIYIPDTDIVIATKKSIDI